MKQCSYADSPWRITFETNPDTCNLRCIMCDTHSPYLDSKRDSKNRFLPFSVIESVIRSAADHGLREVIPSTMGEPLMYPEFDKLLDLISELDLRLNLTTNGTFPGIGVTNWGRKILPVASDVKISINGATKNTAENIMRNLDLRKQTENADKFLRQRDFYRSMGHDPTVTMQVTFMRSNVFELPAMLENAINMGFDRFKGHHVWVTNPKIEGETLKNPEFRNIWNETVDELRKIAGNQIELANIVPFDDSSSLPLDSICPFIGKEAWIGSNGQFHVCCAPAEEREVFGNFGNVNDDDFLELWNSPKYLDFFSGWGSYDLCQKCNMRITKGGI
ncbi:radical SAM protein [Methanolacinia paynteri]|uniref:radical SAM protein n=1 Tax=Methanolacinia paynteri TaxID=230356 RepID=UPI000694D66E|nr:radical SAM protein [Methanolacinia paynteri]